MPEDSPSIQLFNESGTAIPVDESDLQRIVSAITEDESCTFDLLEVVYVDEEEILRINREYLEHDYVTDIITFRYDENESIRNIEGTLYCCTARIYEQAIELDQEAPTEFQRILIHGLLHLCGYQDETDKQKQVMTARENHYLEVLN